MNLLTGTIEEIFVSDGMTMGKVNIRGAYVKVPLTFLISATVGDTIVIDLHGNELVAHPTDASAGLADTGKMGVGADTQPSSVF